VVPEPLRLLTLEVLLEAGPSQYVHLFDATELPADGAIPIWRGKARGNDLTSINFIGAGDGAWEQGVEVYTGLVAALSSTAEVLTLTETPTAYWQGIIRVDPQR